MSSVSASSFFLKEFFLHLELLSVCGANSDSCWVWFQPVRGLPLSCLPHSRCSVNSCSVNEQQVLITAGAPGWAGVCTPCRGESQQGGSGCLPAPVAFFFSVPVPGECLWKGSPKPGLAGKRRAGRGAGAGRAFGMWLIHSEGRQAATAAAGRRLRLGSDIWRLDSRRRDGVLQADVSFEGQSEQGSQGGRGCQGPTLPHPGFWKRGEAPSLALSHPFSHQSP